ncbi:MAG TPA: hypothetical protein VF104_07430 [Burkholderiales bacterium]
MAFSEDLAPFFDTAGFGVDAVLNGTVSVRGILDEAYVDPLGMSAAAPAFTCAAAALVGNTLDIGTRHWKVVAVEPDGTGVQVLKLQVVP